MKYEISWFQLTCQFKKYTNLLSCFFCKNARSQAKRFRCLHFKVKGKHRSNTLSFNRIANLILCIYRNLDYNAAPIKQAYCMILMRCPDPQGLQAFTSLYTQTNGDIQAVVHGLIESNEFYNKYLVNNPSPIDMMYTKLLGRPADIGTNC